MLQAAMPAAASPNADREAIASRLQRWASAFNARDAAGVCDLFAQELIATVPGAPLQNRRAVCGRLAAILAQRERRFSYAPDIREIIVSGNLAVVRIVWTLSERSGALRRTSREFGIDVFKKDRRGKWSIVRFLAFSEPAG